MGPNHAKSKTTPPSHPEEGNGRSTSSHGRRYTALALLWNFRRPYLYGVIALVIVDLVNVGLPLIIKAALDDIQKSNFPSVMWAALFYLGLMITQAVGRYIWRKYLFSTSFLLAQKLRTDLFATCEALPMREYQHLRTGDLMARATNDIEAVRIFLSVGLLICCDTILVFLFTIPAMAFLSLKLMIASLIFFPIAPLFTKLVGDKIDTFFEKLQIKMSQMSTFSQESFLSIRFIQSLVLERAVAKKFMVLSDTYRKMGISLALSQSSLTPVLSLLTFGGIFVTLLVGSKDVVTGVITVGTVVAFHRFIMQLAWPMEALGWMTSILKEGQAAMRRLNQIFDLAEAPPSLLTIQHSAEPSPPTKKSTFALCIHSLNITPYGPYDIRDSHFSFSEETDIPYRTTSDFTLSLPDAEIKSGKKIGLIGEIGSGKTTLFYLLLRLLEPPKNKLYFFGEDITSIETKRLRQEIAYVPQTPVLFSASIKNNLEMGNPRKDASPTSLLELMDLVGLKDEIASQAFRLETVLNERGNNLSGGQRQRLAIARALFRNPHMLLMDDPFSSVDRDKEEHIFCALLDQFPDLTIFLATQRLSMMPLLDEIWVFHHGKIVQKGTHPTLLESHQSYREWFDGGNVRLHVGGLKTVST